VLDVRVYRAAFLPALLALFVVAFSLEGRPSPVRTRAVADAFDPARAYGNVRARDSLLQLGDAFPERRPGSAGDAALAARVEEVMRAAGFQVQRKTEQGRTVDGETELETVVGVRPGLSNRRIVVIAHRDSLDSPGLADLSGTAALLELARIFRTRAPESEREATEPGKPQLIGRDLRRTLVLVSTSGGSGGGAGARAWAREQDAAAIDGVLVLGDMASAEWRKPWVVPWSNGDEQPPLGWRRTVETAVRREVGTDPGGVRAIAQWSRRALPLAVTEQGEVNRAGLPAVLLQISGERGPERGARISRERFTEVGRGALRSVIALDEAGRRGTGGETRPLFRGEPEGVVTLRNVLPEWSVRLAVLCLLLPALLAALDAFFRARRRKLRTGAWLAWALAAGVAVPLAWIWLRVLGISGALPAPHGPVAPGDLALETGPAAALASVALPLAGGLLLVRPLTRAARGERGNPAAGAAGAAAGAIVCGVAFAVWLVNPYAAALLLPAAHLWLFLGAPQTRLRGRVAWLALAAGLLGPLLVLAYEMRALRTGPFELARMWLVATAGGHVSAWSALAVGALAGCVATLVRILRARRRIAAATPAERPRTRGPASYAGPGSLGGTESALRR
jgi:Peptidase family M28